jgi:hypothetical protein
MPIGIPRTSLHVFDLPSDFNDITYRGIDIMPDRCVQCHQVHPGVEVDLLRIKHPTSPFGVEAPLWTLIRQQYCHTCYRQAEQEQHRQQLAKLWMALLPMMWFLVGGTLLYVGLYPNPATTPVEVHLVFFGTTFTAFYAVPATIYRRFKRLDPVAKTSEAIPASRED